MNGWGFCGDGVYRSAPLIKTSQALLKIIYLIIYLYYNVPPNFKVFKPIYGLLE